MTLFKDPALCHARWSPAHSSQILLVGGYTGWSNFGDWLQLDATIQLYQEISPDSPVVVFLDARSRHAHIDHHRALFDRNTSVDIAYFAPEGEYFRELEPFRDMISAAHGSCLLHIYGGGFINQAWGPLIRSTVNSINEHISGCGLEARFKVVLSGQQVSDDEEHVAWGEILAHASAIGVRDRLSLDRLSRIEPLREKIFLSGDDAYSDILKHLKKPEDGEKSIVAIHVNLNPYSTENVRDRLEQIASLLGAAHKYLGNDIRCRMLVAYNGTYGSEPEAVAKFKAMYQEMAASGLVPHVSFEDVDLFGALIDGDPLSFGHLVISCSYHVALSGVLSGCPTLLLAENKYYEHKAQGLLALDGGGLLTIVRPSDAADGTLATVFERKLRIGPSLTGLMAGAQSKRDRFIFRTLQDLDRLGQRYKTNALTSAFREISSAYGELKRRHSINENLAARELAFQKAAASWDGGPSHRSPKKYLKKGYWIQRGSRLKRSIDKRLGAPQTRS